MLVWWLWSHIHGYVIIRANGRRLEALINSAVRDGIHLWRIERASDHLLVARVAAADFSRLARHGRRLRIRVDVLRKLGLPFWFKWAGQRRGFVLGGTIFVAVLYGLAQFVWFVQVDGARSVAARDILKVADAAGLRPGVARSTVQRADVERNLYLELPGLAWAAVELRGTVATVRVVERTSADPVLNQVGHVVAVRNGIVEKVSVTTGQALVAPGDTIEAGTPLISGMLEPGTAAYEERLRAGLPPVVRAAGTVLGRTWYRGYGEARAQPAGPEQNQQVLDRDALIEAAVTAARSQATERLPADAEIIDEDVVVVDDSQLEPRVVRAAVTVTVLQNLGRFSPMAADEQVGGHRSRDETDG